MQARRARRLRRARTAGARGRCCETQAAPVAASRRRDTLLVETLRSRAKASTCSSIRSPGATCTSGWRACWPGGSARDAAQHLQHLDQRLRLRAAERASRSTSAPRRRASSVFADERPAARRARQPELDRAGAAALSRDRARRRADLHRLSGRSRRARASCRRRARCSSRSSASTTRGNLLLTPGRERGAEPGAGDLAPGRHAARACARRRIDFVRRCGTRARWRCR